MDVTATDTTVEYIPNFGECVQIGPDEKLYQIYI